MKKIPETDTMSRLSLSVKGWKGSGFPEMGVYSLLPGVFGFKLGPEFLLFLKTHHITLERLA